MLRAASAALLFALTSARAIAWECIVLDPKPPLNIRATPNGTVTGSLENGMIVTIPDADLNTKWARASAKNKHKTTRSGVVAREFLSCQHSTTDKPLAIHGCDELWFMRNSIYATAGYCFSSDRAKSAFSNESCKWRSIDRVELEPLQARVVASIRQVEDAKNCSGRATSNLVPSAQENQFLGRDALIAISSDFLSAAGVANFKYLPASAGSPELLWEYQDGSIGALLGLKMGSNHCRRGRELGSVTGGARLPGDLCKRQTNKPIHSWL
ncbi:MAG: YARHG domain-containing protein [Hyphomicrobiaceae bacterium]